MKIGIDARPLISDQPSGIGVYVANIIQYIHQHDDQNEYILYTNKPLSNHYRFPGNIKTNTVAGKVGTFWVRYALPQAIKDDHIDVFWGTQHILPKKVKGVRYVLTVHDLALLVNPSWGSYLNAIMQNIYARLSIRDADCIIADSNSTKEDICRICHVPRKKVSVIYLGGPSKQDSVEPAEQAEILRQLKINMPYYLYLGTIEPRKNISSIVTAFENIAENNDSVLVLAGGLGWKYKKILQAIANSKYKDRIILTGYVSAKEKETLLKNCLCFLFPSHYEGFGIPVLEAFMNGAIVVTSCNSSLPEVGGNAALYIDNENDYIKLSALMLHTAQLDTADRKVHINKGYKQASLFTWSSCAGKTMEIIQGRGY